MRSQRIMPSLTTRVLIGVIAALSLLVLMPVLSSQLAREAAAALAQSAAALFAAHLCRRARSRDVQTRTAWTWAARSTIAWAAGNLTLLATTLGQGRAQRPGWADLCFLVSAGCAIRAATAFPSLPRSGASLARILLDGGITGSALLFSGWVVLAATVPPSAYGSAVVAAGYPVIDMVIVVVVLSAALRLPARERTPLLTVSAGVVLLACCSVAAYVLGSRSEYVSGDRLDLGMVAALTVIGLGAAMQPADDHPRAAGPLLDYLQLSLPYAPVGAAIAIGVAMHATLSGGQLATAAVMTALVVARQLLLVLENDALVREMARRARRFEAIIDGSHDLTLLLDRRAVITWASPSVAQLAKHYDALIGVPLGAVLADPVSLQRLFNNATRDGAASDDTTWTDAHGQRHDYELRFTDRFDDPLIDAMVVHARDVTARRAAETALARSEERYRRIVEASSDGIWLVDAAGITRFVNGRVSELSGLSQDQLLGRPALEAVGSMLAPTDLASAERRLTQRRHGPERYEVSSTRADGEQMHLWVYSTPLHSPVGEFEGSLTMITDITVRKRLEEELLLQATTDALTGLGNRESFLAAADDVLQGPSRSPRAAVLFCDLDGFKAVNDTYGHSVGDDLLRAVARRLRNALAECDVLARMGGDEFAALLHDVADEHAARRVAERLIGVLDEPVRVGGRILHLSGSIGIALADPTKDVEQLLREADLAMYQAKGAGRGRCAVFAPWMHAALLHRMALEMELREAMAAEQFELAYQPITRLADGHVVGVEALLRWPHPSLGMVAPDDFIGACEESGLIVPLGAWILEQGCAQLATWLRSGLELNLGINIAAAQLEHGDLAALVEAALRRHGLPAHRLVLEITERALLAGEQALKSLQALDSLGVLLALDDFGTGQSSLAHLRDFPVDIVKIDKSYVERLTRVPRDAQLARGLVNLARGLGLDVVAEGIETREQEDAVRALGCELGQGFRYAAGMSADEATEWLRAARLPRVPSPRDDTRARLAGGGGVAL